MDGALTVIHICVDSSQTVLKAPQIIHICVDSSRTVLEHHRSFIPSTLVSQLKEKKILGSPWEHVATYAKHELHPTHMGT